MRRRSTAGELIKFEEYGELVAPPGENVKLEEVFTGADSSSGSEKS